MPKFIYIGIPKVHTTETLLAQSKHLKASIGAAALGKTPPATPDKYELLGKITKELAARK